jgi:hypothetical protein
MGEKNMADSNYEKYLVKKPDRHDKNFNVKNMTSPPLIYMSSAHIPEANYNVEFGWVWGMPQPNPFTGNQVSEFDQVLLHVGGDYRNPEDLGAEIEFALGGQILKINSTGAIFIPKGITYGPLTYKNYSHPHARISLLLGTGVRKTANSAAESKPGINFEKYQVKKPAFEVIAADKVANRQEPASMTFMSRNLVPESNVYVEGGWVFGMPSPNPHIMEHVHRDFEELVLHFGTDYEHPEELGGEIEFSVGGQPLKVDKTSMVFVPKGISHGPLVWKKYSAPHLEMAIIPGAGSLAEADPGGHQEKMQREGKLIKEKNYL